MFSSNVEVFRFVFMQLPVYGFYVIMLLLSLVSITTFCMLLLNIFRASYV